MKPITVLPRLQPPINGLQQLRQRQRSWQLRWWQLLLPATGGAALASLLFVMTPTRLSLPLAADRLLAKPAQGHPLSGLNDAVIVDEMSGSTAQVRLFWVSDLRNEKEDAER